MWNVKNAYNRIEFRLIMRWNILFTIWSLLLSVCGTHFFCCIHLCVKIDSSKCSNNILDAVTNGRILQKKKTKHQTVCWKITSHTFRSNAIFYGLILCALCKNVNRTAVQKCLNKRIIFFFFAICNQHNLRWRQSQ